jgi:hypothetical protein
MIHGKTSAWASLLLNNVQLACASCCSKEHCMCKLLLLLQEHMKSWQAPDTN